ncbi:oxidoreductase [Kitasatospora cheerisanensis KCTC 2395]|uniref:Oxidoreductase n=1 Tax=Kitasatospora cheerisanensis KCTC 2395 TaxID=1348663 RepID=A0A066YMP0_9ACTN|nr:oxidoreductase [Kitasatospora cheerisanensis KCTC 2395]
MRPRRPGRRGGRAGRAARPDRRAGQQRRQPGDRVRRRPARRAGPLARRLRAQRADRRAAHRVRPRPAHPRLRPGHHRLLDRRPARAGSYGAAKASLHAWNHFLAAQLGPSGITANIVAPGTVAGTEFFGPRLDEAEVARRSARTLLGRIGESGEVAAAVCFLASAEAGFITGEILHCNGGELLGR